MRSQARPRPKGEELSPSPRQSCGGSAPYRPCGRNEGESRSYSQYRQRPMPFLAILRRVMVISPAVTRVQSPCPTSMKVTARPPSTGSTSGFFSSSMTKHMSRKTPTAKVSASLSRLFFFRCLASLPLSSFRSCSCSSESSPALSLGLFRSSASSFHRPFGKSRPPQGT